MSSGLGFFARCNSIAAGGRLTKMRNRLAAPPYAVPTAPRDPTAVLTADSLGIAEGRSTSWPIPCPVSGEVRKLSCCSSCCCCCCFARIRWSKLGRLGTIGFTPLRMNAWVNALPSSSRFGGPWIGQSSLPLPLHTEIAVLRLPTSLSRASQTLSAMGLWMDSKVFGCRPD